MRNTLIGLAAAALLAPAVATAQTAADSFSYQAPSGMFGEGMAKWQLYRFIHEDKERTARFNARQEIATGAIRGTSYTVGPAPRLRRPGEPDPRRQPGR